MSTQRERRNPIGPGYQARDQQAAAPAVALQGPRANPMRVTRSTGLENLDEALGGFFGRTADAVSNYRQIEQADRVHAVRMENEELALQGASDRLKGVGPSLDNQARLSYIDAYARTNATLVARDLADRFREGVQDQPLDGSFDIDGFRKEFLKREVGDGTGDPLFDAPLLAQVNASIDPVTDGFKRKQAEVTRANGLQALGAEIEGFIQDAQGISKDRMADLHTRATALFQGDRGAALKWVTASLTGTARNPGQVETILKAMEAPGPDGRSYAQQFPEVYTELSGRLLERLSSLKTYEGVQTHSNFLNSAQQRLAQSPTVETTMRLLTEYDEQVWDRYGGIREREAFHASLTAQVGKIVDRQVESNAVLRRLIGVTPSLEPDATAIGKTPQALLDSQQDSAAQRLAQSRGIPLAVTQTEFGHGAIDILGDDTTADFMADVVNQSDGVSANFRNAVNNGLVNLNDPARASRAFRFLSRVYGARGEAGGPAMLDRVLNDQGKSFFYSMQAAAEAGQSPQSFIESLRNQPEVLKILGESRQGGAINWATLTGQTKENSKIQREIDQSAAKALNKLTGWFGDDVVFQSTQSLQQFRSEVALQLAYQRGRTTSPDVDAAVEAAAKKFATRFMLLPSERGTVSATDNVFGRTGEVASSPTGRAIVAPLPFRNPVTGEDENPVETWKTDLRSLARAFPGTVGADSDRVFLRPSSDTARSGMFTVFAADGRPLVFTSGQELTMQIGEDDRRGGVRKQIVKVPEDYTEAVKALQRVMPPGFYIEHMGREYGTHAFRIRYGFRYATEPADAAALGQYRTDQARANPAASRAPSISDNPAP
jgi:hypothetical protein